MVGEEYIEDVKSDVGKVIGYKCTLCDCRFNDVVARTAHVKGRRHRLNYKVCWYFYVFYFIFYTADDENPFLTIFRGRMITC